MSNVEIECLFDSANYQKLTPGLCRRSEIDRASRIENRGLPTLPTRIRYKVDYANAHRTRPMTEKPAGGLEIGQPKEIQCRIQDGPSSK